MDTAEGYRRFADVEAQGTSPAYERIARSVTGDERLLRRQDRLPIEKRQPNLLLAACRLLGANEGPRIVPGLATDARPPDGVARAFLVVGVGGSRVAAIADLHGAWLTWLEASKVP